MDSDSDINDPNRTFGERDRSFGEGFPQDQENPREQQEAGNESPRGDSDEGRFEHDQHHQGMPPPGEAGNDDTNASHSDSEGSSELLLSGDDEIASAADPDERYEPLTMDDLKVRQTELDQDTRLALIQLEAAATDYCDMIWTFGRAFYPQATHDEVNKFAAAGSLFGIDRAMEAEYKGDRLFFEGLFKKNRGNAKRIYGSKKERFQEIIVNLRRYYEEILRPRVDAVYLREKRNLYLSNLFGLVYRLLYHNREIRTKAYTRGLQAQYELMKEKEQELADLLKNSVRSQNLQADRKKRVDDLTAEIDRIKAKNSSSLAAFKHSQPSALPGGKPILIQTAALTPTLEGPPFLPLRDFTKTAFPTRFQNTRNLGASPFLQKGFPKPNIKGILKETRKSRSQDNSPHRSDPSQRHHSSRRQSHRQSHFQQQQPESNDMQFQQFMAGAAGGDGNGSSPSSSSSDSDYIPRGRPASAAPRGSPFRTPPKEEPFVKQPTGKKGFAFPGYGHVSPNRIESIRRKKESLNSRTDRERLEELSQAMTDNGMTRGHYTETNLTSAALMMKFFDDFLKSKKNHKKIENEFEIERINHDLQDLSLHSFDFNIDGITPEDILGPRFMNTVFADDVSRMETMRAILQYVVNHPGCRFPTKGIILNMLGQFDIPRNQQASIALSTLRTMGAISSPYNPGLDEDTLIEPPVLGTKSSYGTHLSKGVFGSLGLSPDDKFCLENPDTKPLNLYLPSLKRIIESEQLSSDSAFTLLLSVLKGDCFDEVHSHLRDGTRTFAEIWISLQKTCGRVPHTGGLEKSLQEIFSRAPACVPAALARIQNIRTKMFAQVPNKNLRQMKISDAVYADYRRLIRHYLPLESVPIDMAFRARKTAHNEEVRLQMLQGIPTEEIKPFNEAQVYKEIICGHLASEAGSSPFPQVILQGPTSGLPKKLTISETELKPILKNVSMPEEQGSSQQSTHSEAELNMRGRPLTRAQGPGRNGSRSGSGRSFDSQQQRQQPNQGYANNQGYNNNSRLRGNSAGRTPMFIPEIAAGMIGERSCYLCKESGHHSYHCTLYPNEEIRNGPPCPRCGAFHSSKCKSQMRGTIEQPRFINEDGTRVPYNQQPYIPGPQDSQQPQRPPYQNPRYGNQQRGPVPWGQPQRRTTNFNGSPNYSSNPRLFDPFMEQRQRNGPRPGQGNNYRNTQSYQNHNRPQVGGQQRQYAPNPEYQRNQAPNPNAIGNAGAQQPPPNVFISTTRIQQQPSHQSQDARYLRQNDQQDDQQQEGQYLQTNEDENYSYEKAENYSYENSQR